MRTALKLVIMITLCAIVSWSLSASAASGVDVRKAYELTNRASEHMNRREYDKALPLLEEAVRLNPDDQVAKRYLTIYRQQVIEPMCKSAAEAYFTGQYPEAIGKWERIIGLSPAESTRVQALIDVAIGKTRKKELGMKYSAVDRLLEQSLYVQAVVELEALLAAFPEEQRARGMLAELSGSLSTNVIQDHYSRAWGSIEKESYDIAINELETILKLDPNQELAQKLMIDAKRSMSKEIYDNADKLLRQGEYLKAREAYAKALESNPTDSDISTTLSRLDETLSITTAFTGKDPAEKVMSTSIYHYVSTEGDPKVSVAAAWYALQISPGNPLAQAIRAFMEKKNTHETNLMESPVKGMDLVEQYLFASLNHIYEGRYDQTLEKCEIVLELDPDNLLALKRMGSAYYLMGKKEKAKSAWSRAIELSPSDQELKRFLRQL